MELSVNELKVLHQLEEDLWRGELRFERKRMEEILAPDFFEFGKSGRVYQREDILEASAQLIKDRPPLLDFKARSLGSNVVQVTYVSAVIHEGIEERALRSSIWSRTEHGWQLRFHQGTAKK